MPESNSTPRYIFDLFKRIVRVSVETMRKDARQKALDDPLLDKVWRSLD